MPTRPPVHHPGREVEDRPTAAQRGYDGRWQRYRAAFLRDPDNALCRVCLTQGRATAAVVVDHVKPHRGNRRLFWDPDNHQGLCKRHHDEKTASGA